MSARPSVMIRPEQSGDAGAIRDVLDAAFGGTVESRLVEDLRAGGHLALSLVAADGPAVVGYVAWPRLRIVTPEGAYSAVSLAPLAVAPSHQRAGVGSALTRAGLAELQARGEGLVFVLGDPAYYQRFGFSIEAARPYESLYAGDYFMALVLAAHPAKGRVCYPAPFDALN